MPFKYFCRCLTLVALLMALCGPFTAQQPAPKFKAHPEVEALLEQAKAPAKASRWEEAMKLYEAALKKAEEHHDLYGQGFCLNRIGNAYYMQGNLPKAQEAFTKAKEWYAKAGDEYDEMGMLGNLAILKDNMGFPKEARPIYLQLLERYRKTENKRQTANMLLNLAILEMNISEYPEVLKYATEARELYHSLQDKRWEAEALTSIANAKKLMGNQAEALHNFEVALQMAREGGFQQQEAGILVNLGDIYRQKGELLKAIDSIRPALKIREEMKDVRRKGTGLTTLAVVYDLLGQSRLAIDSLEQAIAIGRQIKDRHLEEYALTNLGVVLMQAKLTDRAIPVLREALTLSQALDNKLGQAACLGTLGNAYVAKKDYKQALTVIEQAIAIYRSLGMKEEEGTVYNSLGSLYQSQKRYTDALGYFRKALDIYTPLASKRFAAATWGNIGMVQMKLGQMAEAEASYRKCINDFEDIRARLEASSEGKAEFLGQRITSYQGYIALLVKRGRVAEAFDLTQKTKGRTLLDLLNAGNVSLQQEMTEEEKAQEKELRIKADQINAAMVQEGAQNEVRAKKRYAALKIELQKAENRLAAFMAALYAHHPGLAQKRSAGTATLAQIACRLPDDTALLEYVAADQPLLFVVTTRSGKATVRCVPLPVTIDALKEQCSDLRTRISNPRLAFQTASTKLYKALIAPVAGSLKGKKRLVICPDRMLWEVPFAALYDNGFLAERFSIAYAYSATAAEAVLRPRKSPRAEKSLLVLANPDFGGQKRFGDNPLIPGQRPIEIPSRPIEIPSRPIEVPSRPIEVPSRPIDPPSRPIEVPSRPIEPPSRDLGQSLRGGIVDLPGTQQEADALKKLFPDATVLSRGRAQESAFVQSAGQYRYLHIASHAFFNDAAPMLSSIVLAIPDSPQQDGYLTAREIFDLRLHADLIVLSACNTARGAEQTGEGVVGLSWALFVAGAPAQVVSQWSVDDRATATLMTRFYSGMKKGLSKGEALREASVSLIKSKRSGDSLRWRHPYYWAPFILLGDWR